MEISRRLCKMRLGVLFRHKGHQLCGCAPYRYNQGRTYSQDKRHTRRKATKDHRVPDTESDHKTLHEDIQSHYDILKIMEPYTTPWRLNERMIRDINRSSPHNKSLSRMIEMLGRNENSIVNKKVTKLLQVKEEEGVRDFTPNLNTIFIWTRKKDITEWYFNNAICGDRYGNDMVIDCQFEKRFMSIPRMEFLYMKSISNVIRDNLMRRKPSRLWLCNLANDSPLRRVIDNPQEYPRWCLPNYCFVRMTEQAPEDIFKRSQLVYMTPNTRDFLSPKPPLPGTVFIIGGLPDLCGTYEKESMAAARKSGIDERCLPITNYLKVTGSTVMPIEATFCVMKNFEETGDIRQSIIDSYPKRRIIEYITSPKERYKPKPNKNVSDFDRKNSWANQ